MDLTRLSGLGLQLVQSPAHSLRGQPDLASTFRASVAEAWRNGGAPAGAPSAASKAKAAPKEKGRAPGKEKQQLVVDCQARPVADRRVPVAVSPPLGAAAARLPGAKGGKYYITTAINYTNGWPHIGHAYEAVTADVFARYHRLLGEDVFFMTGADEHGQKIAQTAEADGLRPIEICDRYVAGFQALNQRLTVSNDFYVRTTAAAHKAVAQEMWRRCRAVGDIYLDRYEGWYLVREERFITETEAQEWNYKDPGSGAPLKKMSEPSFFFRLSKYQAAVIKHIEDNELFIQPAQYRTEVLERLRSIEMRDLSVSRGNFDWGIECPEEPVEGKKHVMYVWFDALINYLSGVNGTDPNDPLSRFWPADMHIIGKDITWFHCVYWPAMLMSAGVPLPKSVVVHGFIAGPDGRKMSKSYGNVVDPHDVLDKYASDTARWYMCRESQFGDDLRFSEEAMRLMHNAELCDNLGNLVNRAVSLCGGAVPECAPGLVEPPFNLAELRQKSREAISEYRLSECADLAIRACGATNKWIADLEPWKMKEPEKQPTRKAACRILLEAVYTLAHFFAPFTPVAAEAIFLKVGAPPRPVGELSEKFLNLKEGSEVRTGSILFEQLEAKADAPAAGGAAPAAAAAKSAAAPAAPAAAAAKAPAKAQGKPEAKAKAKAAADDRAVDDISRLDIRVGRIVKVWPHPDAEKLYCEEIDLGEDSGPRTIASGLRAHLKVEEMQDQLVLVLANLKARKMQGFESQGMVLCANSDDGTKVELMQPPAGAKVGERVVVEGAEMAPADEKLSEKTGKNPWEALRPGCRTTSDRKGAYNGKLWLTSAGPVACKTVADGQIS